MKKSDIKHALEQAASLRDSGKITQKQYDLFIEKFKNSLLSVQITDPVWEKPLRPITKKYGAK